MIKRAMLSLCGLFSLFAWPALAAVQVQDVTHEGMSAWLAQDEHLPIIELRLIFKGAGHVSDPAALQGRAALAADLLTKGAGERDRYAFQHALESHAISLSAQAGRDHFYISLKTLRRHKQQAFELLQDMLTAARFDDADMQEAKRRFAVARVAQQESPYYLAQQTAAQTLYANHPYAQAALGSDETMQALTSAHLQRFMAAHITKRQMLVNVVGHMSAQEVSQLLATHLAGLPEGDELPPIKRAPFPPEAFTLTRHKQLPQSLWHFMHAGIARSDEDFYAAYLLNYIVGGGSSLTSRLGEEVRKKRGLTYGIGLALEENSYANRWAGSVATQNATAQQAKQAILDVFADVAKQGITQQELDTAKAYLKGSFPLNIASNKGVAAYLNSMRLHGLGRDYLDKRDSYFGTVTLAQVNALAKRYFVPENWSWVLVGAPADTASVEPTP